MGSSSRGAQLWELQLPLEISGVYLNEASRRVRRIGSVLLILAITDVSSTMLSEMELFSQYSAVAYCNDTYTSVPTLLSCSTGNCPVVEASNATTTSIFR